MSNGFSRVPLLVWVVLLLATALAAVIAMATLHDAVGFALAVSALVVTVVATLLVVRAELTEEEPSPVVARFAHQRLAGGLALLVAVVMLAIAAFVVSGDQAASSTASDSTTAAVQTVRDYATAMLDQAGETACNYLTLHEQQLVARLAGPDAVCRDAFSETQPAPTIPGSVHAIQALAVTATVRNGQARVVLGQGSGALSFVVRRATAREKSGFKAPPSDWRIAAGAASVLAP